MIAKPNDIAPRILTSSWSTRIPADHIQVGISRGQPRSGGGGYKMFRTLAPGDWFKTVDAARYRALYFAETLGSLDPISTVGAIVKLAGGRVPVLCCYESPDRDDQWCHRGFVSAWLSDAMALPVYEFGHEDRGYGWSHPKLPAEFRTVPAQDGPARLI